MTVAEGKWQGKQQKVNLPKVCASQLEGTGITFASWEVKTLKGVRAEDKGTKMQPLTECEVYASSITHNPTFTLPASGGGRS